MRSTVQRLYACKSKATAFVYFLRTSIAIFVLLLSATAKAQTYTPMVLSGLNADVIANGPTFAGSTTADVDGAGYYFLNQSFTAFGAPTYFLPNSGLINAPTPTGLTFQLAD